MIEGLVTGTLIDVAESRKGKNDTTFTVAKVKATAGDGENLIVNVIAFATEASSALLALDDGDTLALAGALTPKVWTDKQGNSRPCKIRFRSCTVHGGAANRGFDNGGAVEPSAHARSPRPPMSPV